MDNPFAVGLDGAPSRERPEPVRVGAGESDRYAALGRLVVRWEKLRWAYNAVLVPWTLLCAAPFGFAPLQDLAFWDLAVGGGLVANACFCLGPLVDGYLLWFLRTHLLVTAILFLAGTLATLAAAALGVAVVGAGLH